MALGGCGQICKWIVILFNILFILVGLVLLGGGLYLRFSTNVPVEIKSNDFIIMVGLCIAIGAVILISSVIGDYGSCSENKSALSVYCSLLLLLTAAATIGGGVAFVKNKEFSGHVAEFYATVYAQHALTGDMIRAFILKLFHTAFDCCGLGGTLQTLIGSTNICPQETNFLGVPKANSCLSLITNDLQASSVLTFFMVIAGILFLVLVCSVMLCYSIKKHVYSSPPFYY